MKLNKKKRFIIAVSLFTVLFIAMILIESTTVKIHLEILSIVLLFACVYTFLILSYKDCRKSEEQTISILDATAEGIYGVDTEGVCIFANKKCVEMLGYKSERDLIGIKMHELFYLSPNGETHFPRDKCVVKQVIESGKEMFIDDVPFYRSDKSSFPVECKVNPRLIRGKINGAVISFRDITKKKRTQERIKYLSYRDKVTGLYNQAFMYEELRRFSNKTDSYPFSVIFGDINGLKLTNDVFGHESGDILLKKISDALKLSCRKDDIIARVGGDEFVILLPKTSSKEAEVVRNRINNEVEKVSFRAIKGSIALGLSTKVAAGDDLTEILKDAEEEMYKNKSLTQRTTHGEQLKSIMDTLHSRLEREKIHSGNVSILCKMIAKELGLSNDKIRSARDAGYYHDIGKIAIEDELLLNQGTLNDELKLYVKKHTLIGYRILNIFNETMDISKGALDHHEYWDGTGYPKALKGDEISLLGRIVSVAEAYDHHTNPYSTEKMSSEDTIDKIKANSGIKYDPDVVDAFLRVMENYNS